MVVKRKVSRGSFMGVITGRNRGGHGQAGNDHDVGAPGSEGKPGPDDVDKAEKSSDEG